MKKIIMIISCLLMAVTPAAAEDNAGMQAAFTDMTVVAGINLGSGAEQNIPGNKSVFSFFQPKIELKPETVKELENMAVKLEERTRKDPAGIDDVLRFKMIMLTAQNKLGEALDCASKILARDERDVNVWFWQSFVLLAQGKTGDAEWAADKALSINPESDDALWLKGGICAAKKDYTQAIRVYNRVLEINPAKLEDTVHFKANALIALERYDEAVEFIDSAFENKDIMKSPMFNKYGSYAGMERYVTIAKAEITAMKAYSMMNLDYNAESLPLFDAALKAIPETPVLWKWKAEALNKLERYDEAAEHMRIANGLENELKEAAEEEKAKAKGSETAMK